MKSGKSIIVLIVDHETFAAEHPDGDELTMDELHRQGSFANDDMAGLYGYEGWNTAFDVTNGLLALIADQSTVRKRAES
jgi:hypothetical protein